MAFPIKKKTNVPAKSNVSRQAGGRQPGPGGAPRMGGMVCPACGMKMEAAEGEAEAPAPDKGKSQQVKNVRNMISKLGMKKSGNSGNPY